MGGGGGGERRRGNIFARLTRTSKTGWRAEKREYIRPLDTNKQNQLQHNTIYGLLLQRDPAAMKT